MSRQALAAIYVMLLGGVVLSPVHGKYMDITGRSGWALNTAIEHGQTGVPPHPGEPVALAITEGSRYEQGKGIDQMGIDVLPLGRMVRHAGSAQYTSISPQVEEDILRQQQERSRREGDYTDTLDYIWQRESSRGTDPLCRVTGPAGEQEEYQITPIFSAEVYRISGYRIDVFCNKSCRYGISLWLDYWIPRVFTGQPTVEQVYEMYRRGPKGYRKAAGQ